MGAVSGLAGRGRRAGTAVRKHLGEPPRQVDEPREAQPLPVCRPCSAAAVAAAAMAPAEVPPIERKRKTFASSPTARG